MIEINLMYDLYVEDINYKLNKALESKLKYLQSHTNLKNILIKNRDIFQVYSNTDVDTVLRVTNKNITKRIKFPNTPKYINGKRINFEAITLYIKQYVSMNNLISKLNHIIEKCNTEKISFQLYKKIIRKFNNKVIDKIVHENYHFVPFPSFGGISVIKNHNERKRVNWGVSNRNKKEILMRGEIPYIKADAEKIKDYKGVEWLEYHPTVDFFLHWHRLYISHRINPILSDYMYKPARGVSSIVSKLQLVKDNRERALNLYTRTLKKR